MNQDKQKKLVAYKEKRKELDSIAVEKATAVKKADKDIELELARMNKTIKVANNANIIISDLERQFSESTKLNAEDYSFLFFSIALQCARWYFQPKICADFQLINRNDRHSAAVDGLEEREKRKEKLDELQKDKEKSNRYVSIAKMFMYPVPYDAMEGTSRIIIPGVSPAGKQLYGGNHHSATMGHDPILGYIFGTANIMTRTITFKNPILETSEVHLKKNTYLNPNVYAGQYVTSDVSNIRLVEMVIGSLREDILRLPAAISRHAMHLESDKFCKDGLPIPFTSAEEAQELIREDWNSHELWRLVQLIGKDLSIAGIQAVFSIFINAIIEQMHKMAYKKECGISRDLYSVKTHRIIEISNVIASSSNLVYSAVSNDLSKLDIGGLCVTLYRMWKDEEVMQKIKKEFVYGTYYDMLDGN